MNDLISRQAAIDKINERQRKLIYCFGFENDAVKIMDIAKSIVLTIPSAQHEPITVNIDHELTQEEYEKLRKDIANAPIMLLPPAQQWTPCSERLPKGAAIVTAETKTYKYKYVCEAVWIPRWSKKAEYDSWEDCSEYNEAEDEYYVLEGWYERVHNWDEYSYVGIEDEVIAWMPLPEPYKGEES